MGEVRDEVEGGGGRGGGGQILDVMPVYAGTALWV